MAMVRSLGRFVIGLVNRIRLQCHGDVLRVVSCPRGTAPLAGPTVFQGMQHSTCCAACQHGHAAGAVLHVNVGVTLRALNAVQQFDRDCVSVSGACV
jgi:hypothetical protein